MTDSDLHSFKACYKYCLGGIAMESSWIRDSENRRALLKEGKGLTIEREIGKEMR